MDRSHLQDNTELQHLLLILDGNGRWASRQNLPREAGHHAGSIHVTDIIYECIAHGIRYISLYAFSTENFKRPVREIDTVLNVFADSVSRNLLDWHARGIQLRHIGKLDKIDSEKQALLRHAIELTKNNTVATVSAVLGYGARDDIVTAVRRIVQDGLGPEQITEETFASYLSSANMPDPDLVIRTGGRLRLSNVLLWELSYSEFWFTDILWPDFHLEHLREAIQDFYTRPRTFGNVPKPSR